MNRDPEVGLRPRLGFGDIHKNSYTVTNPVCKYDASFIKNILGKTCTVVWYIAGIFGM
jgi:hypothetical protein